MFFCLVIVLAIYGYKASKAIRSSNANILVIIPFSKRDPIITIYLLQASFDSESRLFVGNNSHHDRDFNTLYYPLRLRCSDCNTQHVILEGRDPTLHSWLSTYFYISCLVLMGNYTLFFGSFLLLAHSSNTPSTISSEKERGKYHASPIVYQWWVSTHHHRWRTSSFQFPRTFLPLRSNVTPVWWSSSVWLWWGVFFFKVVYLKLVCNPTNANFIIADSPSSNESHISFATTITTKIQ